MALRSQGCLDSVEGMGARRMIGDLASICFLSYNRPVFLAEAIETARENAGYPCEIIVNDDGSTDGDCYHLLNTLVGSRQVSKVIFNPAGNNQGVGESIRVAFGAASGDVLVKADQDLIFNPGWLRRAVDILFNVIDVDGEPRRIGMLGLFHYQDVADERFRTVRQHDGWQEVTDFVGSAFLIARDVYDRYGPIPTHSEAFAEDVELKLRLVDAGLMLALPDEDLCVNRGFGVGPSTVALGPGPGQVQAIHRSSIIYHA